jgi:hypothetical protein
VGVGVGHPAATLVSRRLSVCQDGLQRRAHALPFVEMNGATSHSLSRDPNEPLLLDMEIAPPLTRLCRLRLRTSMVASLVIVILALIASAPMAASTSSDTLKKCIEVKDDYDLRQAARDTNVFLMVHEPNNKEEREYICKKLEATPEKRIYDAVENGRGTIFAYLEMKVPYEDDAGVWQEGNRNFVKNSLDLKSFPAFLFLSKGMNGHSKYSSHVTRFKGTPTQSQELTSEVEKFIEKNVGYKIGNDVYNIIFFDTIVARFVSYGNATGINRMKQRFLALIVRTSTLFSFKEPFSTLGKLYNRAFSMSLTHGMEYSEKQVKKLEKKLSSNRGALSEEMSHEIRQKIAILKSFSNPKEITPNDEKQIWFHAMLHIGLIVATVLLFITPRDDSDSNDADGEEKAINDVPIIAKPVD